MPSATEPLYGGASSPLFPVDSNMSGGAGFDFDFNSAFDQSFENTGSPGVASADESFFTSFGSSPYSSSHKSPLLGTDALLDAALQHSLSAPSTASPAGSSHDSSSESSGYKRKSSSDSSRSVFTSGEHMISDDADASDLKMEDMIGGGMDLPVFGQGTINPASMEFNDKSMEQDFDFDSAASSPSHFAIQSAKMDSPDMPTIKHDTPRKHAPAKAKYNLHNKRNSQQSITQSMYGLTTAGSREASPLSAMITSQESSPCGMFNSSPSPGTGVEFINGTMLGGNGGTPGPNWTGPFGGLPNTTMPIMQQQFDRQQMPRNMFQPFAGGFPDMAQWKPTLTIHPTPLKSRVETQIPIKMTLFPVPPGTTKLHLPTHTISKPKMLAKPAPEKAPDTLELYTSLVCTSAMQSPENRRRAFERAAAQKKIPETKKEGGSPVDEGSGENDENKPLDGGDVTICTGCITRERKRAARKKVKKIEEEESWHKDEAKRVIVFNTHEIKDWQQPTPQPSQDNVGDFPEPLVHSGAMQVDAPMRIACYCRHQNEKLGFQVIFTIKDYQGKLVAQAMTNSIMITDDHKTHMPALTTQASGASDTQMYNGSGAFPTDGTFDMSAGPAGGMAPFRVSHSTSDLQGMQRTFNTAHFSTPPSMQHSQQHSQNTSATMTPRNLSRQTSPSASSGPNKKRKASGSIGKVPTGLAMTRLETGDLPCTSASAATVVSASTSAAPSPFTPNMTSFPMPNGQQFGQSGPTTIPAIAQQYNTSPPTPNGGDQLNFFNGNRSLSMENLVMGPLYSAPASAHPSRVPSPNGLRSNLQAYQAQQDRVSQAYANGVYGVHLNLNPHQPPTIHKLIPNEGPKAGGIEVTCLGSGFVQGLEVMFGESKATTTTYWGETSLVCLLPPSAFAGTVPVIFKHQQLQQIQAFPGPSIPKQQAYFKYVDDDEQQIIRTALSVLGHKMTGKMEDVRDLARRIVGDGSSSWGASTGNLPTGGNQGGNVNGFNAATFGVNVESTLLKIMDLIDLDDSPNQARLNLRRASGQTMLHLAASLGLQRFVAALLARGANPEPRDKGGFTPMHFAALHNHPQIVRRLMLSGADPAVRSLQGYTPSDMATSEEVLRAVRRIEHHSRTRSGGSMKSRTSSATSLRSVWEPLSTPARVDDLAASDDSDDGDNEYEDEDDDDGAFYMKSRHPSVQKFASKNIPIEMDEKDSVMELPGAPGGLASPTTAVTAFRDQLTAQIQHQIQQFQRSMHNLPQMPQMPQMPRFDNMPALPDYQHYLPTAPMVRRISNLVGTHRPGPEAAPQDYRWWDLFSGEKQHAPPAYEEIFPQGERGLDAKESSAMQAAADACADKKCSELFDQIEASSGSRISTLGESSRTAEKRSTKLQTVRIGQKHTVTREQQDQLRLAHAEKMKRLKRDKNLFFIWIPLLVIMSLAILYNNVPQVYSRAITIVKSIRNRSNSQGRIAEVV